MMPAAKKRLGERQGQKGEEEDDNLVSIKHG
jgi:hypothetical protein